MLHVMMKHVFILGCATTPAPGKLVQAACEETARRASLHLTGVGLAAGDDLCLTSVCGFVGVELEGFFSLQLYLAGRFVFLLSWEAPCIIFSHLFHHSFPSSCYHLYSQKQWLFFPPPLHRAGFRWIDFPLLQRKSFMFAIV